MKKLTSNEELILTVEELYERCFYWQDILGLQVWEFEIKIVDGDDLHDSMADIVWVLSKRQAVIRILEAEAYRKKKFSVLQDMERSLVHELVHATFAGLLSNEQDSAMWIMEEQAVNTTTNALIKLQRKRWGDPLPC